MKKRTKASKNRLNNLLILLLLSAVLLVMSTYAWFTANRTVRIDTIDVNVATQGGLQISADGETWKSVITKEELIAADNSFNTQIKNQLPNLIAPVSSPIQVSDGSVGDAGHLIMYHGQVNTDMDTGNFTLTSTLQSDRSKKAVLAGTDTSEYREGYYVAFDFWLKLDSLDNDLYWSGKVVDNSENDGTLATGTDKGLASAARVALIRGKGTAGFTDNMTALPNVVRDLTTVGGDVTAWEPDCTSHNAYGVNNYNNLWATVGGVKKMWPDASLMNTTITNPTAGSRLRYDALNDVFADMQLGDAIVGSDAAGANGNKVITINSAGTATSTADSGVNAVLTSQKGEIPNFKFTNQLQHGITKFRAYMWVEGQDVDCENSASGTYLRYDLKFSLDSINT